MLPVTVARSFSDDNAIRYVLPVLWMTSYFHIMGLKGQNQRRRYVWLSLPGGGTSRRPRRMHGAKSAIQLSS